MKTLVAIQAGVQPELLTPSTTLFGDLGVDGDDADELFMAFAAEFGVDLSGLDLRRHFGSEGWSLLRLVVLVVRRVQTGEPHQNAGLIAITMADLLRCAEARRWVGPQSESEAHPEAAV